MKNKNERKSIKITDPFFIYGLVAPSEYNWRKQFTQMANHVKRDPRNLTMPVDIGKVLGIVRAYNHSLNEIKKLKKEIKMLKNPDRLGGG